jgi:hypothetical protein
VISKAQEYRAKAAEFEEKARTMKPGGIDVKVFYETLAEKWRTLAILTENQPLSIKTFKNRREYAELPRWPWLPASPKNSNN